MEMSRTMRATASLFLWLSLGCQGELSKRTQIMLVVDSDLPVPAQLDGLELAVEGPTGAARLVKATLGTGEEALPRSLGLVHEGGPLGPLQVTVTGVLGTQRVVERRAELAFVEGKTLVLPLHLFARCVAVACGEQTCTERGCVDATIDPDSLAAWDGEEPRVGDVMENGGAGSGGDAGGKPASNGGEGASDAAGADAGSSAGANGGESDGGAVDAGMQADAGMMCAPSTELCNQKDDNCNGQVDEGFDLQTDRKHCGSCNNLCAGARPCCAGQCRNSCN
jgi:hypothetical protein